MDLYKLKSGTDVRGTATEGYGPAVDLSADAVKLISDAFGVWLLARKKNGRVAVGCDSRLSSSDIKGIVIDSLADAGFTVLDCGLCSTPSMFMTTQFKETSAIAAVMVTASHHPPEKNGLKFFTPAGGLGSEQISEIIDIASRAEKAEGRERGEIVKDDFMALYCDFLVGKVRSACGEARPLDGFKIAVDAGNGAGAFYVDRVLKPLGADTSGSQYLDPDGNFPNHIPNPENPAAMQSIADAVVKAGADLGVIFDTDVDRAAVVDSSGQEINRNALIALISAVILKEQPGATIVTDSVTSDGLAEFIAAKGGVHHRFKRGYKNVIDEARRLCDSGVNAPLAIETSGHAALKENYFLDDGAYLVTRLIIEAVKLRREGKTLTALLDGLKTAKEELEIRLSFKTDEWKELGGFIIESVKKLNNKYIKTAPDNYEGVRASVPELKGWFLIRMSVHDPIMPINIESDITGGAGQIARLLYSYLKAFPGLDVSSLAKAAGLERV